MAVWGDGWGNRGGRGVLRALAPLLSLALLAGGLVAWKAATDSERCADPPDSVLDLVDDSSTRLQVDADAAPAALDPADNRGALRELLAPQRWPPCTGQPGELLGTVLVAAATGGRDGGGAVPHTEPMARVAHETVVVLDSYRRVGLPEGLAPSLARILAAYVTDTTLGLYTYHDELDGEPGEDQPPTLLDPETGEARVVFDNEFENGSALRWVVGQIAADPEAHAILHDAFRAQFAHYLDHLSVRDGDLVAGFGEAPTLPGNWGELARSATGLAELAAGRERAIADGRIADPDAFDADVLAASAGGYPVAEDPAELSDLAGDVARRPPEGTGHRDATEWAEDEARAAGFPPGAATDWFLDGRAQLAWTLDGWAADRGVEPELKAALDALLERGYLAARADADGFPF